MKLNHKIKAYYQLSRLIENQNTGTADQLAKQIGVSRSTLFNMLDELRGSGVGIVFDDVKKSYVFTTNKRIKVNTPIEVIEI